MQVVVAHPDDETFGCGSLLLHAAAAGAVTAVCCATRGEAGEPPEGGLPGAAELGALREAELHAAAALLCVTQVDLLDFTDSGMNGPEPAGSLCAVPFDAVVAAVTERVLAFRPDVLVTLDASDGHRDHSRIRYAALAAAQAAGVPAVYLHCLPRSLMRAWADHMRANRPELEHLAADVAALGTPDAEVTTVLDTREHLAARRRAIAAHASQVSPFEGLPADLQEAFLSADHLRRVVPPWSPGPQESSFVPRH